jgi:hypothetical protein
VAINSSGSASLVWRVRKSGNNLNGGGYDPAQANVLATTLNGAVLVGATSITVASATGWPTSGNFYARIGNNVTDLGASRGDGLTNPTASEIVLVTGGQGTTTWTVTRGQLGTSAAAWASGTVVDNELTRCDTAAASGSVGTSTASTTFVDATFNAFNPTHVGNVIYLSAGTGTTPGFYTVVSITSSSTVVLDRASGTYTAGVWNLGGGWADPRTNTTSTQAAINAGNTYYIQGGGTDPVGPRTADYTPGISVTLPAGTISAGAIKIIGEYGRPALQGSANRIFTAGTYNTFEKICCLGKATQALPVLSGAAGLFLKSCIFDQNGFDQPLVGSLFGSSAILGCEFFNSGSAPTAANNALGFTNSGKTVWVGWCNFHNLTAGVIATTDASDPIVLTDNVFSNCGADVITLSVASPTAADLLSIQNNVFDANVGNCVTISVTDYLFLSAILNNIFSNNVGAGKTAINVTAGATAANDLIKRFIDYNSFYNNTANVAGISLGKHDTLLGSDPYVGQSTQNYTLA